ncbi:mechanosensitive ion channel protein MscS [Halobacteriales archaeon SW_7_68_16]|nr:MAG: mechanosensitive ion channel protein MscS [Halobacteriales archaeon SW_7_68_16]
MTGHDLLSQLDRLSTLVETTEMRIVATVALVVLSLVATVGVQRLRDRLTNDFEASPIADLLVSLTIVTTFVGVGAASVGLWGQAEQTDAVLNQYLPGQRLVPQLTVTIVIVAVTHVISRFLSHVFEDFLGGRAAITDHQREVSYRVVQVVVWTVAFVVVFGVWQINPSGLLVGAGFAGIVIGMAARQTLSGILAGFVLMFSRPFKIGDWVVINDQEGTVTDISIVNTRIRTFNGEYVMLPNDEVTGSTITNRSRKGRLRIDIEVGVDYDTDVERAVAVAEEAVEAVEPVIAVPPPSVVAKRFDDSAVVLGVRFWIEDPSAKRKWRAQTAVVGSLHEAFDREDITIPFPQRTMSSRDANAEEPPAQRQTEPRPATDGSGDEPEATGDGA